MNMFAATDAKTPEEYIAMLSEPQRSEVSKLHDLIRTTIPEEKPHIHGGMIGYGMFHFIYASGREVDWPIVSLSGRKNYLSLYVCASDGTQYIAEKYRKQFPKASIGKSCIRFKTAGDIDLAVLAVVIQEGVRMMRNNGSVAVASVLQ